MLSLFVGRLVPQMLQAIEGSGLREFTTRRLLDRIRKIEVAPLMTELFSAFTEDHWYQRLLDKFTKVIGNFLRDEQALALLREKIREQLTSVFNMFRAYACLLKQRRVGRDAA